jgi:transcriptional regulator GlxA family with amidase domain
MNHQKFNSLNKIVTAAIFACLIGGCSTNPEDTVNMNANSIPEVPSPDRVFKIGFLAVNGVYNSELIAPMDILHHTVFHTDPGMEVFVVSPTKEPIITFEGLRIIPDYSFDEAPAIDVLVVPSAKHSMDTDLEDDVLIQFVKDRGAKARYVISLCDGAFVLAKAGLTDGHESTTFPSDIPKYRIMFPNLTVHEAVSFVHDTNLITSAGGAKSYDPALYLVELLYGQKVAQGIAGGLVIDWNLNNIDHIIVE